MNAIARLAVAAIRQLFPKPAGSALALRSPAALAPRGESRSTILFPTARLLKTLDAPPAAVVAPLRRRRKVVTETITYEERKW